jgi:hypothetical protein
VTLGDAHAAAGVVRHVLEAPESELLAVQAANWKLLDEHYNWDRFAAQVVEAIEASDSPPMGREWPARRAAFMYYSWIAPYGRLGGRLIARWHRILRRLRSAFGWGER